MVSLSIDLPVDYLNDEAKELVVPRRRKELWAVLLDLFVEFDRVCKKHGIKYFCDGGTALGAVRHRGFIPWDDDFDVVMSRSEYERLNEVAPEEFHRPYFWQTNETDPGSARGHAQLRNSQTTAILKSELKNGIAVYGFNQGVFLDVFPFDNIPDDLDERRSFLAEVANIKSKIRKIRLSRSAFKLLGCNFSPRLFFRGVWQMVKDCVYTIFGEDELSSVSRSLEYIARRYENVNTLQVAPITFNPYHKEILPSSYFLEDPELVPFEFREVPLFKHWREALLVNYGDWHEHVVGASSHGGLFIDLDKPYTEYLKK